jgi:signal transduction histidine kinase/CheY-like chemotaxis protein/PAS domain-containing protein
MVDSFSNRDVIINALNKTIEIFTSHSELSFNEVISNGLHPVADAAKLDRVSVYRLLDKESGRMGQIYVWAYGETVELDKELIVLPDVSTTRRWLEKLLKGECINENVKDMDDESKVSCGLFNIKAILLVPVFTHGEFWGVITLEDHTNYRYFDEDCLDLLTSAASLCANAFMRNEIMHDANKAIKGLKYREILTKTLSEAAIILLTQTGETIEDIMTAGIRRIVDIVGVDRLTIWCNFKKDDVLHGSQVYRWHRYEGGTTATTEHLKNIAYSVLVPRWEKLLADNESINGPASLLPEYELLKSYGIVSVFITPVFINGEFWGFALYEDQKMVRFFDDESAEMMRSAALLCASTVIRTNMERDIIYANEFNNAAMATMPIGFTVFDHNLQVINCNNAILKIFETTKEYYTGNFSGFSPEYQPDGKESRKEASNLIRRSLAGENLTFEWMHRTSSGNILPFEITLTREMYKGNYIVLAYQYDLHNIKEMEKAINEAEELTHTITEASPIPYVLFNEDLRPIDCNEAAIQIFGSSGKQQLLDGYWNKLSPKKQPDGEASFQKAKLYWEDTYAGKQVRYKWVHKSFSGEIIPVENTMTYIIHKGAKFAISFKYDLRETNKMLENIREHSELLKSRLEQQELLSDISRGFISSGDSEMYIKEAIANFGRHYKVSHVLIFNVDYQKHKVRPVYHWISEGSRLHMVKVDLIEIIKSSFPERLSDCPSLPVVFCDDIKSSNILKYQPLLKADVCAFIYAPLYVDGRLWGALSVEQCHTRREWTSNEKDFVALMAGTIAGVIMRNIYNKMLKDALEKATIASKAKGDFLSNISHEMRTPLNAIIGMTAIAKNALDMERKNYALNKIDNASAHLLGVINDVLDMSKIEANKLELSSIEFNFKKMLQKAIAVVTFRVDEKQQKLSLQIDDKIPEFLIGDDQRLTQVITNLLGNAVKFTSEDGFININAYFLKEENDFCVIQISISDTGIGLSKVQQTRLFQSFQQAEAGTVRKYGGTGLGLAISKNIIEMMGGKIWVESKEGKGSTFSFTIQAMRGKGSVIINEGSGAVLQKKDNEQNFEINSLEGRNILLAEDIEINREIVITILEPLKLGIDCAENGSKSVEMYCKDPWKYDLIFMDIQMPEMDGYNATRLIRLFEEEQKRNGNQFKRIPIVAMTANVFKENNEKCINSGMDDHIGKPLDFDVVMEKIRTYIK